MLEHGSQQRSPSPAAEDRARRDLEAVALTAGDIAIDCGANVGKVTEKLCRNGATVYAFEPNPYAFEALQRRFAGRPNVRCIQAGVFVRDETTRLYLHENSDQDELYWSTGSSLLAFKKNVRADKYVEVPVIDLCAFIRSLNARVRVLKMDVEGVECPILKKLMETGLIHQIDHLFVETHDHKIPALKSQTDEIRTLVQERNLSHVNLGWV